MNNVTVAKFELVFTRYRKHLKTEGNLTVKNSLQDAKEMHLHSKNRPVSFQKRGKMFCLHHFRVFTRCCFKNVPVRVPFSRSTVFKICRRKMCRFRVNGSLSVTFFTVFRMCRHLVNADTGASFRSFESNDNLSNEEESNSTLLQSIFLNSLSKNLNTLFYIRN